MNETAVRYTSVCAKATEGLKIEWILIVVQLSVQLAIPYSRQTTAPRNSASLHCHLVVLNNCFCQLCYGPTFAN